MRQVRITNFETLLHLDKQHLHHIILQADPLAENTAKSIVSLTATEILLNDLPAHHQTDKQVDLYLFIPSKQALFTHTGNDILWHDYAGIVCLDADLCRLNWLVFIRLLLQFEKMRRGSDVPSLATKRFMNTPKANNGICNKTSLAHINALIGFYKQQKLIHIT